MQLLNRHRPFQAGNHNVAMPGGQRAIHHQNVVREDTGTGHRLAFHPHKERSRRMADAQLVQIEGLLYIVLRRRRKASRDALGVQRHTPGRGYRAFDSVAKKGDVHVWLLLNTVWIYRIRPGEPISKMVGRSVRGVSRFYIRFGELSAVTLSLQPNTPSTLLIVSSFGLAPSANDLYRLARATPALAATSVMPLARAATAASLFANTALLFTCLHWPSFFSGRSNPREYRKQFRCS